jgi:hypothetical protein
MLLGRVHNHSSIRLHLALVDMWHEAVNKTYHAWAQQTGKSYDALLEALQALGCKRSSALTVQFWVSGVIMCPSDPEDIRRVAKVLGIPSVLEHYARIARAAERLRGLHRGLAHRLNNWLRTQVPGSAARDDDDIIDQEIGLRLSDFRESFEVLLIRNVELLDGMFLRASLNHIVER